MLIRVKEILRTSVQAADGKYGRVKNLLFDDENWVVRYLYLKQGFWVFGSGSIVSPMSIVETLTSIPLLTTNLTKQQIKDAPSPDLAKPVSRKMEIQFHARYGMPVYWGGAGLWGTAMTPLALGTVEHDTMSTAEMAEQIENEFHLRSVKEVIGYKVTAAGNEIGRVKDFLVEDDTWAVRYLIVKLNREMGYGLADISPQWVKEVSWMSTSIDLDLEPQVIRDAPGAADGWTMSREEEEKLYDYYRRPRYWMQGVDNV